MRDDLVPRAWVVGNRRWRVKAPWEVVHTTLLGVIFALTACVSRVDAGSAESPVGVELGPGICYTDVGTDYEKWDEDSHSAVMRGQIVNAEDFGIDFDAVAVVARNGQLITLVATFKLDEYENVERLCHVVFGPPVETEVNPKLPPPPRGVDRDEMRELRWLTEGETYIWRAGMETGSARGS